MSKQTPDPHTPTKSEIQSTPKRRSLPDNLLAAMGTKSPDVAEARLVEYLNTLGLHQNSRDTAKDTEILNLLATLGEIRPQDEFERMLVAQMIACHRAAMESFRRALIPEQTFVARDVYFKHAAKLTAAYSKQLDTLNKHRGKGQQKVTVEHVHVASGGQAIVGHVEAPKSASRARRAAPQIEQRATAPNALNAIKTAKLVEK